MTGLANQFSFLLFSIAGIALITGLIWRLFRPRWPVLAGSAMGLMVLAVVVFFVLRPGVSDVNNIADAEALLTSGRPTMVEFFSNYCIGCMSVRPAVDALVADLDRTFAEGVNVLRVDIHTDFGRELRERYAFSFTPEFILFDAEGQEVWRGHLPPALTDIVPLVRERG